MINEENLNKMYNGLIDEKELTTKELNSYGFNSKDLTDLINDRVLERVKRGYYSFLSIDDLFYYGKQLIASKEYDKATACFKKCYELNPNHLGACFQLFLRAVQSKNYEEAFTYFEHFYDSDNEYYNNDSNFYLYLFSMITEIPEQHREYAKYLKLEDIRVDFNDKRFNDPYSQNKVRISALNQKFTLASKQLNELIKQHGRLSVQDIITRTLLSQAIEVQNELKKNIANLAIEKKYKEIIAHLEKVQEQHHLSTADECILFLAREVSKLEETGIIPEKEVISTNKLFEAINGKNFELALSLSKDYIERNNIDPSDNAMFMLLKDITELTKTKTNKAEAKQVVTSPVKKAESVNNNTTPQINASPMTSNITFATVIGYLMQQDFDNSFRALRGYLNGINKSEYEFLIIDLIKISLIEQDVAFSKPMIALTYVSRENFTFDISEYIQNFYETLAQNRFTEARIYLDIISKSNKLGQNCVLTDGLEQVLNTTEKMLNYKRNNETLDRVDASIKNVEHDPVNFVPVQQQVIEPPAQYPISDTPIYIDEKIVDTPSEETIEASEIIETTKKTEISKPTSVDYDDSEFINGKLSELYEKGIVLLKPMDSNRRKGIHDIVKDIPDVTSFSIGTDSNRQIVLRFKPFMNEYLDFSATAKEGNNAYNNGQYDDCIESYRKLLEFGEPKAWVYAKLGLAYMKKFDKDTAIDYLTIATALSKEEQTDFDFTELIASLKGLINPEDKKPRIKMTTDDFGNDTENYYGIENINELAELISSGINIDDVCTTLGLNDEQKAIATLVLARESYAQENYTMGDQYLKKVEKSKNKTKFVTSLFEEVRKNKRFYRNRVDENHKPLVLTKKKNSN